eukprot:622559-Hanusia_phi.AAC.1
MQVERRERRPVLDRVRAAEAPCRSHGGARATALSLTTSLEDGREEIEKPQTRVKEKKEERRRRRRAHTFARMYQRTDLLAGLQLCW